MFIFRGKRFWLYLLSKRTFSDDEIQLFYYVSMNSRFIHFFFFIFCLFCYFGFIILWNRQKIDRTMAFILKLIVDNLFFSNHFDKIQIVWFVNPFRFAARVHQFLNFETFFTAIRYSVFRIGISNCFWKVLWKASPKMFDTKYQVDPPLVDIKNIILTCHIH